MDLSVTRTHTLPEPVEDVEAKIEDAAPDHLQPEVDALEQEFDDAVTKAVEKAPEEEAKAAEKDPAVEEAAKEASTIAQGGTVSASQIASTSTALVKEVKAGWKTTEFWVSAAVIVLSQVGALNLPGKYGTTITTVTAAAAYAISRGLAK